MKTTGVPVSPTMRYARVVPLTRAELRTSGAEPPPQAASRQSRGTSRIPKGWRLPARFATGRSPSRYELPARLDGHLYHYISRRDLGCPARGGSDHDRAKPGPRGESESAARRDFEE